MFIDVELAITFKSYNFTGETFISNISRYIGFPCGPIGKESACNVGDLDLIPGLERYFGGGHGNPLQYSCLENPHRQRSLVSCRPWGHKESDMTEQLSMHAHACAHTDRHTHTHNVYSNQDMETIEVTMER